MNVLAFECDQDQAAAIQHVVCDVLREELTVVHSVEDAVRALRTSVPDLVLLPALMLPADETALLTSLRMLPDGGHIETLVTPVWGRRPKPLSAAEPPWWRRWQAGQTSERPAAADDKDFFAQRLAWSLQHARWKRDNSEDAMACRLDTAAVSPADDQPGGMEALRFPAIESWVLQCLEAATPEERAMLCKGATGVAELPSDRRAHRRFQAHELTGLRSARIKFGPQVSVIDLSVGGALFETSTRVQRNREGLLELYDGKRAVLIPFRVLRCHVAALDSPWFREACVFTEALDLSALLPVSPVAVMIDQPNATPGPLEVFREDTIERPPVSEGRRMERRRHLRVDGAFEGFRHDDFGTPVNIRNLSEGGCFVDSLVEEREGRQLLLDILARRDERITVTGRVVHNSPGFGFALRFVDVSAVARASLARFVAARTV